MDRSGFEKGLAVIIEQRICLECQLKRPMHGQIDKAVKRKDKQGRSQAVTGLILGVYDWAGTAVLQNDSLYHPRVTFSFRLNNLIPGMITMH